MDLDFSDEWRIILEGKPEGEPEAFAATELAAVLTRMGCRAVCPGDPAAAERIIVLHAGTGSPGAKAGGRRAAPDFSWRAAPGRVEIYGEDSGALLRGVYDFLDALGARWTAPGPGGETLPRGPILALAASCRASDPRSPAATLILGHGAYLEAWEEYLPWAARVGYSSIFIHTTPDSLALGAAPQSLYDALRLPIAAAARRLGLVLELGVHGQPGRDFCPSSDRALALAAEAFAAVVAAHPEVKVFHAWPDDLPEGPPKDGRCSCAACASLSPAAQALIAARAFAGVLSAVRPDAALSFHSGRDSVDIESLLSAELAAGRTLPSNLELLWAPRLRSRASALGDAGNALNAASLAAFRATARAWRAAGGGRIGVFEYWEDAVLFKTAVPPLSAVIEGDLVAYLGAADAVGILCAGSRLPLAPRPNAYLLPRLAAALPARDAGDAPRAPAILADWARAAYGPAAPPMLAYWRELESAWSIALDIEEGECAVHIPDSLSRYAADPPADWGDPWRASAERLALRRDRCEELFDHLRRAEGFLAEGAAAASSAAAAAEGAEYPISGSVLELECARLSAYHELAAGDRRAAADIANLALSASGAVRKALGRLPDRRSRREARLTIELFYDLRLKAIRRANARSGIRRLADLWSTAVRIAIAAASVRRGFEPKGLARDPRRH